MAASPHVKASQKRAGRRFRRERPNYPSHAAKLKAAAHLKRLGLSISEAPELYAAYTRFYMRRYS